MRSPPPRTSLPGIRLEGGLGALFAVALILGLVNALVRPVLRGLSCGLIVLTLGLFLLVINAAMLLLCGAGSPGSSGSASTWTASGRRWSARW